MSKKWISFCVFILGLAIQPSICFSEAGLHSEKINMTRSNNLEINKTYKSMTQNQYIAGGILGAFHGFGIGYAIQGRWLERGWIFTSIQLGCLIAGYGLSSLLYINHTWLDNLGPFFGIAILVWIYSRIWEMVDLWMLPYDYKIVQEPKLSISPLYSSSSQSSSYGLSLSYKW